MKKSTKHMQFIRISLLIFALGFFFACSLGTQSYGKLSLSIEVPDYLKTETKSNNTRFIHPKGNILNFELSTQRRVIHTQSITLNSESQSSPQKVSISVDKVPYNVPLFAKITVYGKDDTNGDEVPLGFNDIYIGYLKSGNNKLTLGVKPVGNYLGTATYEDYGDDIYIELNIPNPDNPFFVCWEIKMLSQKGLYTIEVDSLDDLVLYASDGRQYKNTHSIKGQNEYYTLVFYHPKDEPSTYYLASSSGNEFSINGTKLEQKILVTQKSDDSSYILDNSNQVSFVDFYENQPKSFSFTIYNPYSYALSFTTKFKNETVTPITGGEPFESKNNFKTNSFPHSLPPGKSQKFEIIFEPEKNGNFSADFTIQAAGLDDFVLNLVGSNYSD